MRFEGSWEKHADRPLGCGIADSHLSPGADSRRIVVGDA
jgi:hypothetical protein